MPRHDSPRQSQLLPYENPLTERFGKDFFATLPRQPGVYVMRGEGDAILYIGKAKDLRARLGSYRRARPEQVSRKVLRMIRLIRRIEWELCESEETALLRENHLLRQHRPPFNVVNVHPETYYLIGLRREEGSLHLRLTTQEATTDHAEEEVFGAYKGRGSVREGYQALLRLLWACHGEMDRMGYPAMLTRHKPLDRFELALKPSLGEAERRQWHAWVRRFLHGTSRSLLAHLTTALLQREDLPRFVYHCIQEDLQTLEAFYSFGPHRNRRLKRHHQLLDLQVIPQQKLDDLIVVYRSRQRSPNRRTGRANQLGK